MLIFCVALFVIALFVGLFSSDFLSKKQWVLCIWAAALLNIVFLWIVFVSKVITFFIVFLLLLGILLAASFLPTTIPVTGDLAKKQPNCAYSLKSTEEDMEKFCEELVLQYNSGNETMKKMFLPYASLE